MGPIFDLFPQHRLRALRLSMQRKQRKQAEALADLQAAQEAHRQWSRPRTGHDDRLAMMLADPAGYFDKARELNRAVVNAELRYRDLMGYGPFRFGGDR